MIIDYPWHKSVAVLVNGLEGQLGLGIMAGELFVAHGPVVVPVSLFENIFNFAPDETKKKYRI